MIYGCYEVQECCQLVFVSPKYVQCDSQSAAALTNPDTVLRKVHCVLDRYMSQRSGKESEKAGSELQENTNINCKRHYVQVLQRRALSHIEVSPSQNH